MTQNRKREFIIKNRIDIIVIAALLLLSIVVLLITDLTKKEGAYAEITADGEFVAKYSLAIDGTYSLNGGTNVLTIENGYAYMSFSNCPDHTCENSGRVKYAGQTIVCLPNKLTVTIVGKSADSVDIVS